MVVGYLEFIENTKSPNILKIPTSLPTTGVEAALLAVQWSG
jgi:hypothetical protein